MTATRSARGPEVVNLAVLISLGLIGEFRWGDLRLRAAIRH
jgi:hypothetical protein